MISSNEIHICLISFVRYPTYIQCFSSSGIPHTALYSNDLTTLDGEGWTVILMKINRLVFSIKRQSVVNLIDKKTQKHMRWKNWDMQIHEILMGCFSVKRRCFIVVVQSSQVPQLLGWSTQKGRGTWLGPEWLVVWRHRLGLSEKAKRVDALEQHSCNFMLFHHQTSVFE